MADFENGSNNEAFSPEIPVVPPAAEQQVVHEPKQSQKKSKVKKGIYYSFLTFVLLFCIIQVGFGAILNISKTISYKAKINTLEKVRDEAINLLSKIDKNDQVAYDNASFTLKKAINRLKIFEQKYVFLRWATGAEYGKVVYVGEDYIEFNIIDVDTMEYRETILLNSQLVLEITFGGADVARIIAEISSQLPSIGEG